MYYIEFKNGEVMNFNSELEMYKSLVKGVCDDDGYELEVSCYGEM